jgi:hypothetical protein
MKFHNFNLLLHRYLGKKVRVVLPSCAVKTIREKFPSENGLYTGFNPPD